MMHKNQALHAMLQTNRDSEDPASTVRQHTGYTLFLKQPTSRSLEDVGKDEPNDRSRSRTSENPKHKNTPNA